MRTNKTKGWQHIYIQVLFVITSIYLCIYILISLFCYGVACFQLHHWMGWVWQRNTREREKRKVFLFSTQWKLCFNKKKQIPIIFSRKLEGNNILYVDFLDSKLLKKSCYQNCQKIHSLSLVSLSLFINLMLMKTMIWFFGKRRQIRLNKLNILL